MTFGCGEGSQNVTKAGQETRVSDAGRTKSSLCLELTYTSKRNFETSHRELFSGKTDREPVGAKES